MYCNAITLKLQPVILCVILCVSGVKVKYIQATTGLADTVLAEMTGLADKLSKKTTLLEEN